MHRLVASIKEFGFAVPVLARSTGEVVDGHLRLKAAVKLAMAEVPVIPCDGWTDAQVKAFRLMVNRSVTWADWDEEALALELQEIQEADFDLSPPVSILARSIPCSHLTTRRKPTPPRRCCVTEASAVFFPAASVL